jgi:hypothetical protein
MIIRSRCIAVLSTAIALSSVAGASAATKTHAPVAPTHATVAKRMAASKAKPGTGAVTPVKKAGTVVAAISAFPTGGKGSGTEATCGLWSERLNEDQDTQDNASNKQDVIDATNTLNSDVSNAMDAGCAVIF